MSNSIHFKVVFLISTLFLFYFQIASASSIQKLKWWQETEDSSLLDQKIRVNLSGSNDNSPTGFKSASRVNWIDQYIEVRAGATVDTKKSINQAHAVIMALKTARHRAYEKLAETIAGIDIDSNSRYDRELMIDANLKTAVKAKIRGARVIIEDHKILADGSIWATVALGTRLVGDSNSLMWTLMPEGKSSNNSIKNNSSSTSGLIIDASGLNLRPAMLPKILSKNNNVVYSSSGVPRQYLVKYGLVGYAKSIDQALTMNRVGKSPLVIKAVEATGDNKSDPIIDDEDAKIIMNADEIDHFLSQCRVIIVTN